MKTFFFFFVIKKYYRTCLHTRILHTGVIVRFDEQVLQRLVNIYRATSLFSITAAVINQLFIIKYKLAERSYRYSLLILILNAIEKQNSVLVTLIVIITIIIVEMQLF